MVNGKLLKLGIKYRFLNFYNHFERKAIALSTAKLLTFATPGLHLAKTVLF
jgi:hypothetical protein